MEPATIGLDDLESIPSILAACAILPPRPQTIAERTALHARFMHALVPAWRSHSTKVLALLSSPSVLILDLAVIVGHYLDLEGMPAERAPEAEQKEEEESDQ